MFKRKSKFHIETKLVPGGMLKEYYYKGRVTCAVFVPTSSPIAFPKEVSVLIESLTSYLNVMKEEELAKGDPFNIMVREAKRLMLEREKVPAIKLYRDFYLNYGVTKGLRESKDFVESL